MSNIENNDRYYTPDYYDDYIKWVRESNENYLQVINNVIHLLEKCIKDYKGGVGWCKEIALDADGNTVTAGGYSTATKVEPLTSLLKNAQLIKYPSKNPCYDDDVYVRARDAVARTIDWIYKGDAALFIVEWNKSLEGSEEECKDKVIRIFEKAVDRLRT